MSKGILFLSMTLFLIIIMAGSVSAADGDVIYVNGSSGSDDNDGLTPETAKLTLNNATGTVNVNGLINVSNGQYSGVNNTNITITKNMTIIGESQEQTIINGTGTNWIFYVNPDVSLVLQNLTLTNATQDYGGAIENYGTLNIADCTFTDNHATMSGGVIFSHGYVTISRSTFADNTAEYGGALWNYNLLTVTGSTFTDNTAEYGGAIRNYDGTANVNFNRFYNNTADVISNLLGSVNAENNWWGLNTPDFNSLLSGLTAPTSWLYMTIAADPTTIHTGEASLITVSFNNLFDGTTVTPLDPATGHIPDGTPVTFNTDLGSIGCKTIDKETSGGIATATLTADETPGIAHVNGVTDAETQNVDVTIDAKSSLYLTVTPSKTNPVVGDTVIYTLKVGNKGPDTAKDVVMTYVVPDGLEFAGANVDVGTWTYDEATRTITWTIGDVPVGDPYMWLSLRIVRAGSYIINPRLSTSTYDPTLNTDTQSLTINAASASNAHAATVSMQNTGMPVQYLVLAILMVIGGILVPKRK